MLDYDSEVYIWIGEDVKKTMIPYISKAASQAILTVNSKGTARMRKITLSLIW